MKPRILQVIATLDRSGAETQFAMLATRLPRNEFEVHTCALTRGGPLAADLERSEIPLTVIGKSWPLDPFAFWRLERHIARIKPDIVQTWMFTANAYGRAAALAAGVKTIIASERNLDPWKSWHYLAIDRYLGRRTRTIIANSRGVEAFYVKHGLPAHKFRLIHNGVGPAVPSDVSREQLLAELGLPSGARLIGSVARFWPQKRIKDLIWATDLLKVIRDDVHLLLIGDGPQREMLERYRRSCQIEDRVHFLGVRHDVPRLMPHFDLLWLASGYEGLPNVVMEAMACGIPVVATDIWGNRELVIHEQTGYLVPVGDRAALARYAHKILDDNELARRLGEAGKRRMAAEFTIEMMVDKHAALYRELLA